jgi:transcription elongation factor GreA
MVEESELVVMTRSTWAMLQKELEEMERELRTTIPATIRKARELGDLRENAEYHSAKHKQANVSRRVAALQLKLTRARFVEDVEFHEGVAGLGTRVRLEGTAGTRVFWILGEGEQHHGPEVISFQSVVGRALMNHSVGEEVELGEGEARARWRIAAVERRVPLVEDAEATPS